MSTLVTIDHEKIVTDSRTLAKTFRKSHKDVLRAFDNLQCSPEFSQRNFAPAEFMDAQGKLRRGLTMTKNGFAILAMGFTGPEAVAFKERYIEAFDAMEEHIKNTEKNLWQKMQALIAQETASQVKASFGSHLMLDRKRELPRFRGQRKELEAKIQPSLLN